MPDKKLVGKYGVYLSMILIILGFLMMIQPFGMVLYTMGFSVILTGVVLFNIVSHF